MSKQDFWQQVFVAAIRAGSSPTLALYAADTALSDMNKRVSNGTFSDTEFL